jgi:lipopolysaccharide export system permease protein
LHPVIASWLSTLIMLPLGIWLTYRATTDQGIMSFDRISSLITKLFKKKEKKN